MATIAYLRVSTGDQDVESQRHALLRDSGLAGFDRVYSDEGVSGAVPAMERKGFADLVDYAREGDVVYVAAVDRLGRDAIDVQTTVRNLLTKGVALEVRGLGRMVRGQGVSELILAVLAQVADMERNRIAERTRAGREAARTSLAATGRTHRGKAGLGRPAGRTGNGGNVSPAEVVEWRKASSASISVTAQHFSISESTVKRYCRL